MSCATVHGMDWAVRTAIAFTQPDATDVPGLRNEIQVRHDYNQSRWLEV